MAETQVIIVGAGISGLSAAKTLHEAGVNVIVLEARDRVGGRTLTLRKPEVGGYVDMGGSYVGPTQNSLLRLIKELGLTLFKVDEEQDLVSLSKGNSHRFKFDQIPLKGLLAKLDLNNFFRIMDEMGKEIPCEAPWNAPRAWEWDRITFDKFIQKNCYTKEVRDFAAMFLNVILTAEPWEASLLWVLWYVKQCDGMNRILSTTNGGQERKIHGGSQQISERIAEKLGSKRVLLSQPVCEITQKHHHVIVKTLSGQEYKGDYVIQAIPPAVQQKIHYTPELPALRNQLVQRLPVGAVMKLILYYKKAFWKDLGFCGSSLVVQGGEEYDVGFTLNDTKPDGTAPAIVGFIAADRLRKNYSQFSKEDRKKQFASMLRKIFGSEEALEPIHYEEKCWSEEQYSGGCYATVMAPGFLTTHGRILREPIGRMYFAGTETAVWWSCYMEGAVNSGERAAKEILNKLGKFPHSKIWEKAPVFQELSGKPFEASWIERNAPSAHTAGTILSILKWSSVVLGLIFGYEHCRLTKLPFHFHLKR